MLTRVKDLQAQTMKNRHLNRRGFFERAADGIGGAALAALALDEYAAAGELPVADNVEPASGGPRRGYDTLPRDTHHPAKAKAVIQLFMNGGLSQVDLFEPKPLLAQRHGED